MTTALNAPHLETPPEYLTLSVPSLKALRFFEAKSGPRDRDCNGRSGFGEAKSGPRDRDCDGRSGFGEGTPRKRRVGSPEHSARVGGGDKY